MRRWRLPILMLLGAALAGALGCRSIRAPTAGTLLIGVRADAHTLCFRAKGQWQGVEVELGRALAARLNLQPVFKAYPAEDLTDALLNGKVDVIMAGLPITPEKRLLMDFASPYLVSGQAAIVRTPDLPHANTLIKIRSARIRIGVLADSPGADYAARYFTRATRQPFPDAAAAVDALRAGQVDLVVHDAPAAWWLTLRHAPHLALAPVLFDRVELAWAFRRSSVGLRESANQALAAWQQDGTLAAILRRWVPFSS